MNLPIRRLVLLLYRVHHQLKVDAEEATLKLVSTEFLEKRNAVGEAARHVRTGRQLPMSVRVIQYHNHHCM